ncbi:FERM and PDZ domain-containing protein 1 isoform X1 [Hippocampus zosterae]|uniref:FERM and PDZ domain-containing protein 1 isoform X1 n=1 Tax=Hippocampus zosterae TaxID=109293 RepID=UPI00223E0FFD|nr:FERM and PDZ domain-containing protein 1 isoform X1 [Hippocampus zosterae]XP_051939162.1 FERM and PDZ domain-containing protein 1 isoform X1 [Hippocampus zosterae]XP_051939163.1 FERM and PDZ domain-containing protein 1 isoform X1 [Hippocampus zosterae]
MELQDRSRSPSRRTSRVEQVVGRWLRRSRDLGSRSLSRDRVAIDGRLAESFSTERRNYPFRLNVLIQKDPKLKTHGLTLSSQPPILVQEVTQGGPADGRLFPGDQLVKINNVAVDDLTPEQAAEIIRECQESLSVTILRTMLGPKSSFITAEKRAKLKSNPVKVHFAEEVEVNGHSQGNSLLFLPNVLKVYLENGQTKAFKFEPSTTVKDIVMTLKEKLSLRNIEHFSLVLEQLYSVTKLLLLHDDEKIQQVVQKKESRDFRCLFRVCFIPKLPETLLQDDQTAFEYLYLQGVNDVLQERFAVEMRCNTALRLAAIHIQERLASCGLSPKTSLKIVTKTWGIDNFVSSTLLRNMREKDLMKAISFQLKKSQSQYDSKQRGLTVNQARINYLEELSELKSYGGKSFSATMMLQDRESTVTLLVGARYGVSQVINHKLSILSTLTEFNNITRLELVPESDKVSLVKIYLQDVMPIALLLETVAAKDMSCLIAGYCRVFVDPNINIFPWMDIPKKHRVSAEEGYVSRCGSDSDHSSDLDMESPVTHPSFNAKRRRRIGSSSDPEARKRREGRARKNKYDSECRNNKSSDKRQKEESAANTEKESHRLECENEDKLFKDKEAQSIGHPDKDCMKLENELQEAKLESGVGKEQLSPDSCHTDSRIVTSPSSDSLELLEEDDLISCSSSSMHPIVSAQNHAPIYSTLEIHPYAHNHSEANLLVPPPAHSHPLLHVTSFNSDEGGNRRPADIVDPQHLEAAPTALDIDLSNQSASCYTEDDICFAELSRLVDLLPSPPEASDDDDDEEKDLRKRRNKLNDNKGDRRICEVTQTSSIRGHPQSPSLSSASSHSDFVFNFDQRDASCYYKLCPNITPDSARSLSRPEKERRRGDGKRTEVESHQAHELQSAPILQPPPGFGDSSSDEEFFDARDGFTSPDDTVSGMELKDNYTDMKMDGANSFNLSGITVSVGDPKKDRKSEEELQKRDKEECGKKAFDELRKRSRKRRSFMETDYTSRVSYPEHKPPSMQDRVHSMLSKNIVAKGCDAHTLSSEPEPSEQTDNPSPTVFSLTYSEGEPVQLESKPIPSNSGTNKQTPDTLATGTRNRTHEMEMEPDAMESKSLTDHIRIAAPSITVVRCRVDLDVRESSEGEGRGERPEIERDQERVEERKKEEDQEQSVTGNGPFTSDTFSVKVTEDQDNSKGPSNCSEGEGKALTLTSWLVELNNKGVHQIAPVHNSHTEDEMPEDDSTLESYCPPPPPPSSPLAPLPLCHKSQSLHRECTGTSTEISSSNSEEEPNQGNNSQLHLEITKNEDEPTDVITLATTASDEVTDSINSDVFDDDDLTNTYIEKDVDRHDWTTDLTCSTGANSSTGRDQSDMTIKCLNNSTTVAHTKSNPHSEYSHTIHSITTKLGVATSVPTCPTSGDGLKTEILNALCMTETIHTSASPSADSSSFQANTAMTHELAKDPPLPTHFIFQSCSPSIMGRLSASTLRGKIQKLPLYLSRSQETLNRVGCENEAQSPIRDSKANILSSHIVKNNHDVTEITKMTESRATETEVVESDDSDTTVTGPEVECEFFVETASTSNSSLVSEVKETPTKMLVDHESTSLPVQVEPQPQHNLLPEADKNTLGPITEPPVSILSSLRRDSTGLTLDTPGPIIIPPESKMKDTTLGESIPGYKVSTRSTHSPPPMVVTTQNLNGPGLHFHTQSQIAQRTSTDRPLMGLCSPAEQTMESSYPLSSGCNVFTFWEDPPQISSELGSTLNLKTELACTSVLTSRCESVVEGLNMDACGCPAVYTNCFNREGSFEEDLTVYEFSCQGSGETQNSRLPLPLMNDPQTSSFLTSSSTHSSPYPHIQPSYPTSELSPLLSPLSDAEYLHTQTQKDTINRLRKQRYPEPPTGFQVLRADVDQLLSVLENSSADRSGVGRGGCHPREMCASHFTENKQVLQTEARRLTACCQKVVAIDQSPEKMLNSLADSFRTLVELAGACIWFSSCDRCQRRNAEAVAGLQDVARSFRDFCLAAERTGRHHSCHDLSTKLLAKQCTALTASVFCLTQIFRTLTAL